MRIQGDPNERETRHHEFVPSERSSAWFARRGARHSCSYRGDYAARPGWRYGLGGGNGILVSKAAKVAACRGCRRPCGCSALSRWRSEASFRDHRKQDCDGVGSCAGQPRTWQRNWRGRESKGTVELSETHPRLFSSVFSSEPVTMRARAVAEINGGSKACVLALSSLASGAVTVSGLTEVSLSGCSVVSNSSASDARPALDHS